MSIYVVEEIKTTTNRLVVYIHIMYMYSDSENMVKNINKYNISKSKICGTM